MSFKDAVSRSDARASPELRKQPLRVRLASVAESMSWTGEASADTGTWMTVYRTESRGLDWEAQ